MKKITNYLMKFGAFMILGMAVYVAASYFEANATPARWIVLIVLSAWFAYSTELGGKDGR